VPNKIKFKKGQEVTWAGMKFKYVGLSEKSPDGNDRRVILKREGIKPVYEVLEREVNANQKTPNKTHAKCETKSAK